MKYVVGIMLTSFGTFFTGEGIGVHWWGDDVSVLILVATYGLASLAFVWMLRRAAGRERSVGGVERALKAVVLEIWGLFVGDGAVALVAVVALLAVALYVQHAGDGHAIAGVLLIAGVLVAVGAGLSGATRTSGKSAPATELDRASQSPVAESAEPAIPRTAPPA
jgi:hypothetical protein